MKITIEFAPETGLFALTSDAGNFQTIGLLEVAKTGLIKDGMKEGKLDHMFVRKLP